MVGIKAIIFDLGGVLLDLDERETYVEFQALGLRELSPRIVEANLAFQKGEITAGEFRSSFRSQVSCELSDRQIDRAWCAMLRGIPSERIAFLEELRGKYRLFLLSNTDDIHLNYTRENIRGFDRLEALFDEAFYSQKAGMRKPDPAIYRMILDRYGLRPGECLFVDDLKVNTDAASALGLKVWHCDLSAGGTVLDLKERLPLEKEE